MMTSWQEITRRELPAFERNGVLAQDILGPEILVITLHETKIDIENMANVAVEVSNKFRDIRPGISDTVLLGYIANAEQGYLLDVKMVNQKSCRGNSGRKRLEILYYLLERCSKEFRDVFCLARSSTKGLLQSFDVVTGTGGLGLFLWVDGQNQPILCKRGDL